MVEAAVDHDRRVISSWVALGCVSANVSLNDVGTVPPDIECGKCAQIGFGAANVWLSVNT